MEAIEKTPKQSMNDELKEIKELITKVNHNVFITIDIYTEFCFHLMQLRQYVSTERFEQERNEAIQTTKEIEHGMELKLDWERNPKLNKDGSAKELTDAAIKRCVDEKFKTEKETLKINDKYIEMYESDIRAFTDFADVMKTNIINEAQQNKMNELAMQRG